MTIEQMLEILENYKLRIPPTVYYELLADVQELEEEQEPTTKNDLGVDCISREQALVAIRNLYPSMPRVNFNGSLRKWVDKYKPYIECDDAIKQLPSVTPQSIKGHWIDTNDDGFIYHRIYKCSHCGATVCEYPQNMHESKYKYCSSCGARMVEPQESED